MKLKPLCSKTHLLLSSSPPSSTFPYSILGSYFHTYSPTTPYSCHSLRHEYEKESKNIRVSVWWDFENCNLPVNVNAFKVGPSIAAAIRASGIKGPIRITAFGDVSQLSRAKQEALCSTGINLAHIPQGGKNSADRSLLVDLMCWVSQNPPPAHLFLISSDGDFASVLHRLRMENYNILLASSTASRVLCSAASIMWRWDPLVKGENLTANVFNQPPDGPYGSWYGHYKLPLKDPFSFGERPCSQGEELTEVISETKTRLIQKVVVKQIRDMLRLYPNGISIPQLYSELRKGKLGLDKELNGYKKLTHFILSLPNILKIQHIAGGKFLIRGIAVKPKPRNQCLSIFPVTNNGNQQPSRLLKPNSVDISISGAEDRKSIMPASCELDTEGPKGEVQQSHPLVEKFEVDIEQPPNEIEEPPSISKKVVDVAEADVRVAKDNLQSLKEQDSISEVGFLKRIWRKLLGDNDDSSRIEIPKEYHNTGVNNVKKSENSLKKSGTLGDSLEKKREEKKILKSRGQENGQVPCSSCSSSYSESTLGKETSLSSAPYGEKSGKGLGLLDLIKTWCFGTNTPDSNSSIDQLGGELKHTTSYPAKLQIFSEDSFGKDLESFFKSQRGSLLISQSKTRKHMARNLLKDGPMVCRSISETDALRLVDILISEKKWVEEYPSEASPFELTLCVGKNTSSSDSHASIGLRSLSTPLQSKPKRQAEGDGDGRTIRIQNISHAGVSQPFSYKKSSERSRLETLRRCQKLVNEIMKDYPEGYNIGSFRKLFLEKYGYHLDVQKLGYGKLVSMLQIMPGVNIESNYIIPSSNVPKCSSQDSALSNIQESNTIHTSVTSGSEMSNASKDAESNSTWEEPDPVENADSSRKESEGKCTFPQYVSSSSDDDSSDSEREPLSYDSDRSTSKVWNEK